MSTKSHFYAASLSLAFHFYVTRSLASTILWTGAGDGGSWNNANNWSNSVPPGVADAAVITGVGTNTTISISSSVSIQNVQCSASLSVSAGSLNLTKGASQVAGTFTIAPDQSLNVSGSNTTFAANGPAVINAANFNVSAGASVSLPGVQNYVKDCNSPNWTVTGSNSVLSLPGLTNLTGNVCNYPTIQATAGGQILATNLANITVGPLTFLADGAGSLINLSGLLTGSGASGYLLSFVAQNGGTISMPQMTGGPLVAVTINPGGVLSTAQLQQLGGITLNGATASFPALTAMAGTLATTGGTLSFPVLTNFDGGNIALSGGAVVTMPALQTYSTGCGTPSWTVTGTNSVLNLPGLTNVTVLYCGDGMHIQAATGGQVLATNLMTMAGGWYVQVQADGTNSLVDFSRLLTVSGGFPITFEASNGGTNWVPQLLGGPNAYVTLNPNATLPVAQLQQLGGITANSVTVNFPALTSFDGGNISLSGGAVVTLPVLQDFSTGCGTPSWTVTGPDSVLILPGLTNVTVLYCGDGMHIQAVGGGRVLATNLMTMAGGWYVQVQADGASSLVDFSGLQTVSGGFPITFEASNGGTNLLSQFLGGPNAYVTLNPDAILPVTQFRQLGGITANGVTASFPAVTNFDGGNISLSGGAVVTLAALQNFSTGCGTPSWTVAGAGSVLSLPGLTNVTVLYCGDGMHIQAETGGQVLATNLMSMAGGVRDGAGGWDQQPGGLQRSADGFRSLPHHVRSEQRGHNSGTAATRGTQCVFDVQPRRHVIGGRD